MRLLVLQPVILKPVMLQSAMLKQVMLQPVMLQPVMLKPSYAVKLKQHCSKRNCRVLSDCMPSTEIRNLLQLVT